MSMMSVKLPSDLGRRAKLQAKQDGVSIQELVETAVAEKIAAAQSVRPLKRTRFRVSQKRLLELLNKAPNVPPEPGDELPPELAAKFKRLESTKKPLISMEAWQSG